MARKKDRKRPRRPTEPAKPREGSVTPLLPGVDALMEQRSLWVFLIVLVVVKVVVFRNFVLLNDAYLFKDIGSDSINSTWVTLFHVVDYLRTDGIPKWSFFQGMGQNLFGVLTFEPFLGAFYIAGPNRVALMIGYVELAKEILAGLFFFLFLRQLRVSGYAAVIGGLLFAFTGYIVLGGGWYLFSYDALCIALLLVAIEKFRNDGSWYLVPIPFALIAAYQPFHLYLYALLVVVYFVMRSFDESPWDYRRVIGLVLRVGALALVGVLASAPFFLSNVVQIIDSPRVGGEASFFHLLSSQPVFRRAVPSQYVSEILRAFSNDLMGTGDEFHGWMNYLEAPLLYAGLITLLLVPQAIALADRRRKVVFLTMLSLCAVPLVFPYFRYAFWLFAGDYFRTFTFFIALILLYLAIYGLNLMVRERRVSWVTLLFTVVGLLIVLYFPTPTYERYAAVEEHLQTVIAVLLIVHGALLVALRSPRFVAIAKLGVLATVAIEAGYFANITVNHRKLLSSDEMSRRVGFNDYTREVIDYLNSVDRSFFRVMKTYGSGPAVHASLNDGMIQRYRSTTAYHPFNQKGYIDFLQEFNVIPRGNETATRWATGPANRLILQSITSVKYGLTKTAEENPFGMTYEHVGDFRDVHLYRNRYALPLGFAYDRYITAPTFAKLAPNLKDQAILKAVVIAEQDSGLLTSLSALGATPLTEPYTLNDYDADTRARRADTLSITEDAQNRIRGTITVAQRRLLFFSIPFDRGWSAHVDGHSARLVRANVGFMGLMLEPGTHTIVLEFQPPFLVAGAGVSLITILAYAALLYRSRISTVREEPA